jgi:hypothetical protein
VAHMWPETALAIRRLIRPVRLGPVEGFPRRPAGAVHPEPEASDPGGTPCTRWGDGQSRQR